MANSRKKPAANSTARKPARGKPRKRGAAFPAPPTCCGLDLAALPSGTLLFVEDGALTPISPPDYVAFLAFDPQRPGGAPFWERP
jgi:hypothetical protein